MASPTDSYAPWQVLAAIGVLILILASAYALAQIHPLAVTGLVPVLAGAGKVIPKVLVRDAPKQPRLP